MEERTTKKGMKMYIFGFKDSSGKISMTMFEQSYEKMSDETKKILVEGSEIETLVKIGEYRDKPQITILDTNKITKTGTGSTDSGDDDSGDNAGGKEKDGDNGSYKKSRKSVSTEDAAAKSLGDLTEDDKGKAVKISGDVKFVSKKGKGTSVTIDDGAGSVKMMIWENIADKIKGFDEIKKGSKISGVFQVDVYRDKVQLKVVDADAVTVEAGND